MIHYWLVVLGTIACFASVIVAPYVVADFISTADQKLSASDWAAWAQALGSIISVATAAGIAVYQQHKNKLALDEQRERRNFAARAILPATLSELAHYINACLDSLKEYQDSYNQGEQRNFRAPTFPAGILSSLKESIEFADNGPRKRLAQLVEKLQIQNSRLAMGGVESPRVNLITTRYTISCWVVDALDLYARVEALFPYARRTNDIDPGEPTLENIRSAANIGHFIDDGDVMNIINRRYD